MKRKVIQLAGKTLVVSLPNKWARKYNIKKGDEVDVEDIGNRLSILSEKDISLQKTSIDISNDDEILIKWALAAVYKRGFDEVELFYKNQQTVQIVQKAVNDLFMGFAIVEHTPQKIVIKAISREEEAEFQALLRRAFLVTLSMGENCLEFIKKGEFSGLKELLQLEITNNQLVNFCQRILNKKGHPEYHKLTVLYIFVWNLEKVCDNYKYICTQLSSIKAPKIRSEVLKFFEEANSFLRDYYQLFYKFDINKLLDMSKKRGELLSDRQKLFLGKNVDELIVISNLINLIQQTADFSTTLIALNKD